MSHEYRALFEECRREIGDIRSRVEKLEGRVASKVERSELREAREGLLLQLQKLEDKIKIEPKSKSKEPEFKPKEPKPKPKETEPKV